MPTRKKMRQSRKPIRATNRSSSDSLFDMMGLDAGQLFASSRPPVKDDPGGWIETFKSLDARKISAEVRAKEKKFRKERAEFEAKYRREKQQKKRDFYRHEARFRALVRKQKPASGHKAERLAVALLKDTPELIEKLSSRKNDKQRLQFVKEKVGIAMKIPVEEALDITLPKRGFLHSKYGRHFAYCGMKSGCYHPKGIVFTYKNSRRLDVLKREDFINAAMEAIQRPALLKAWEKDRARRYDAECKALQKKRKASDAKYDPTPKKRAAQTRRRIEDELRSKELEPMRRANQKWLDTQIENAKSVLKSALKKQPTRDEVVAFFNEALLKRKVIPEKWPHGITMSTHRYGADYDWSTSPDQLVPGAVVAQPAVPTATNPSALSLGSIKPYLPEMARKGVSTVARSPRGFLTAYRRAGGKLTQLSRWWRNRRIGFIKRHMAQARRNRERLWKDGRPSRRALALIAWAYMPKRSG